MPQPLAPNELHQIIGQIYDHVERRLHEISNAHPSRDRYANLSPDQQQFVADCVNDVIAELDRVLAPVPDEDEIGSQWWDVLIDKQCELVPVGRVKADNCDAAFAEARHYWPGCIGVRRVPMAVAPAEKTH